MGKSNGWKFKDYFSLVKFSHTIFALPFALIGYFLAIYEDDFDFSISKLLLVILCMIFARNAAMSFNRVTDRFIDKRNPRTASREIPSGKIHPRHAFMFSMINAIFFIVSTFFINKLVFYLSPIALLVILGYSYTKRFTILCHFILGLGLSLAPIGAYLAVTGKWDLLPVIYSLIVFLWVAGFDIIYSLQDEEFDKEEALRSIPAVLGKKKATIVSLFLHLLVALLVVKTGLIQQTGLLYWIGAIVFIGLLIFQHIAIRRSPVNRIDFTFAALNGLASLLFAVLNILSLYFSTLILTF